MTYIGQQPATTFDSGIQDRFTGLTTNTVTLNHEISAEEDILVVWNNIVQDKNSYSVGGSGNKTVTLGGTLVSGDVVTVYYTNKVMQSVNPTAGSVTSTTITDDVISGQTALGATPTDTDELLVSDAGVLKRVDYSYLKGEDNNPSFSARMSAHQGVGDNVTTKVAFDTTDFATSGTYDTSNYRFTPAVAGNYQFMINVVADSQATANLYAVTVKLYKNGSALSSQSDGVNFNFVDNYVRQAPVSFNVCATSDADDYFEVYTAINDTSGTPQVFRYGSFFSAFKISGSA